MQRAGPCPGDGPACFATGQRGPDVGRRQAGGAELRLQRAGSCRHVHWFQQGRHERPALRRHQRIEQLDGIGAEVAALAGEPQPRLFGGARRDQRGERQQGLVLQARHLVRQGLAQARMVVVQGLPPGRGHCGAGAGLLQHAPDGDAMFHRCLYVGIAQGRRHGAAHLGLGMGNVPEQEIAGGGGSGPGHPAGHSGKAGTQAHRRRRRLERSDQFGQQGFALGCQRDGGGRCRGAARQRGEQRRPQSRGAGVGCRLERGAAHGVVRRVEQVEQRLLQRRRGDLGDGARRQLPLRRIGGAHHGLEVRAGNGDAGPAAVADQADQRTQGLRFDRTVEHALEGGKHLGAAAGGAGLLRHAAHARFPFPLQQRGDGAGRVGIGMAFGEAQRLKPHIGFGMAEQVSELGLHGTRIMALQKAERRHHFDRPAARQPAAHRMQALGRGEHRIVNRHAPARQG